MDRRQKVVVLLGLGLIAAGIGQSCARAQTAPAKTAAAAPDLNTVIADLNAAAAKFKSAQADFSWDQYQAVVQEHDIQSGTIYFDRHGMSTWMAAYVKQEGGQNAPKDVVYDGSQLQLYQPAIRQMTVFHANAGLAETFFALGFGGSGDSLKQNWDVTVLGRETMNGVPVVKLDLKPKTQSAQNTFTHVTIWMDTTRGISLKQIFYQSSGDESTNTYSNIRYNQPVDESVFHLKVAPGTAVVNK